MALIAAGWAILTTPAQGCSGDDCEPYCERIDRLLIAVEAPTTEYLGRFGYVETSTPTHRFDIECRTDHVEPTSLTHCRDRGIHLGFVPEELYVDLTSEDGTLTYRGTPKIEATSDRWGNLSAVAIVRLE